MQVVMTEAQIVAACAEWLIRRGRGRVDTGTTYRILAVSGAPEGCGVQIALEVKPHEPSSSIWFGEPIPTPPLFP